MEERRIKGTQIPDGMMIATITGSEHQCSKLGCDSWKTIGVEVESIDYEGFESVLRYSVCLGHLGVFIDEIFFQAEGLLVPTEDCGDPDCPIHGDEGDPE